MGVQLLQMFVRGAQMTQKAQRQALAVWHAGVLLHKAAAGNPFKIRQGLLSTL